MEAGAIPNREQALLAGVHLRERLVAIRRRSEQPQEMLGLMT